MKKIFIAVFFAFFSCAGSFAAEVSVTGIKLTAGEDGPAYEIIINNAVVIKDVKLVNLAGRQLLKFPEYVSRKKRVYPQVVFTTRRSNEAVRTAVINNSLAPSGKIETEFKVVKFAPFKKKSNMKVLAAVAFNDALEVECKIMEGKNGPWVSWPSRKDQTSGEWHKQVFITDKRLREAVEDDLLSRYQAMAAEKEDQP